MMSLYSILLLVGSAIGQRQAGYVPPVSISTPVATYIPPTTVPSVYLPPTVTPTGYLPPSIRTNTVTRTVTETKTLTAEDCRTEDKYASNTYELINQQLILVTQCTKNVLTETVQLTVVTPVNSQVVVRSTTTKIRPTTTIVTNIGDRLALTTVTDTITATMTHRANQFFSTTLTETRTETLTRTTLVISTQVNKRITQVTTTQTVQNTIVVDPPVPAPRIQFAYQPPVARPAVLRPQAIQQSVAQAGITSGQVFGFGGETAGTTSGQTNLGQSTGAGITSGQVFGFGGETTGAGISSGRPNVGQATGAGISRRPVLGQAEGLGFGSGLGALNAQTQGQAQLGFAQGGFLEQDQSQLQGSRGQGSLQAQQQSQAISGQGFGLQGQAQGGFNFGSPSGPAPGLAQFGRPQTRPGQVQSERGARRGSNYQQ